MYMIYQVPQFIDTYFVLLDDQVNLELTTSESLHLNIPTQEMTMLPYKVLTAVSQNQIHDCFFCRLVSYFFDSFRDIVTNQISGLHLGHHLTHHQCPGLPSITSSAVNQRVVNIIEPGEQLALFSGGERRLREWREGGDCPASCLGLVLLTGPSLCLSRLYQVTGISNRS